MEQLTIFDLLLPAEACRGLRIAITGTLPITRAEMITLIKSHSGMYDTTVTRSTDILILGNLRPSKVIPDGISRKLRRAQQLQAACGKPKIVSFEEFEGIMEE